MSTGPQGYGSMPDPNQPEPFGGQPYARQYGSQPNGYAAGAAGPPGPIPDVPAGGELTRAQYWSQPQGQGAGQGQPGWGGPQYQAMPVAPVIVPKNGGLGVLVSFFIPGVGSMINGSAGLGVAILICYAVSWLLTLVLIGIPLVFGVWIWGMVDGYLSAQRWNRAHGIIS
jgi:TM2 domain-containing membrane protein YozV